MTTTPNHHDREPTPDDAGTFGVPPDLTAIAGLLDEDAACARRIRPEGMESRIAASIAAGHGAAEAGPHPDRIPFPAVRVRSRGAGRIALRVAAAAALGIVLGLGWSAWRGQSRPTPTLLAQATSTTLEADVEAWLTREAEIDDDSLDLTLLAAEAAEFEARATQEWSPDDQSDLEDTL